MTAPRAPTPVEVYGPELLAALIKGSKERVIINLTYKKAHHLRSRLHSLRNAMRANKHELYPIVAKAKLSVVWEGEGFTPVDIKLRRRNERVPANSNCPAHLIIQPVDLEFQSALQAAGIEAPIEGFSSDGVAAKSTDGFSDPSLLFEAEK